MGALGSFCGAAFSRTGYKGEPTSAEHLQCFLEQRGPILPRHKASFATDLVSSHRGQGCMTQFSELVKKRVKTGTEKENLLIFLLFHCISDVYSPVRL